ncbi:Phospholipase D alpha 1 [Armadillidium nasatum]|uniref:phospholipase D n=1 Tax=Armadillidium nasatum TaxID=96803 RepID=A0A5N5ST33_9CRUS|nr:Phospholipase D alpha 1 [Armadillidium nasatum]
MSIIRGNLFIKVYEGKDLQNKDDSIFSSFRSLSDPWVEILIEDQQILSTKSIENTLNPKWNANAIVPLCYSQDFLSIKVWDDDLLSKTSLGESTISLAPVYKKWEKKEWVTLNNGNGQIYIYLKFIPFINSKIKFNHEPLNIDYLYFAPRKGGNIQLYQDAHVTSIPELHTRILSKDNHNAFEDIANAFENAQKFIYVAGWSVWTELEIKKDGKKETIGDILKRRSEAGVNVLVLLWNDKFSAKLCQELFGTHVTKTLNFFKGSKVKAIAARRQPLDMKKIKEQFLDSIYTHHMKIIITDCPKKGLIGFVGGYDLTDGRWDTPEHPIWETLKNVHKNDFYNGFLTSISSETGPREPWHDVHARAEGLVALDLLRVFEERWKREVPALSNLLISFSELNISVIKETNDSDFEWHSQILRSSNTDSAIFNADLGGLIDFSLGQKDCSVHHGIISLIRQERIKTSKFFPMLGASNSVASKWQSRSRFIVYVHSKMTIADDARIVIGSANMNQRSLDGSRDTECSLAASQVKYSGEERKTREIVTDGAISEFRRCLWFEHSGGLSELDASFADPSSKECITAMKEKALSSLYPLNVTKEGEVEPFPEIPNIPDFGLPVKGKRGFIPKCVTT